MARLGGRALPGLRGSGALRLRALSLSHARDYGSPNRAATGAWSESLMRRPPGSVELALGRGRGAAGARPRRARGRAGGRSPRAPVGSPSPKRSRSVDERLRVAPRAQVEVAAEHERVAAPPTRAPARRRAAPRQRPARREARRSRAGSPRRRGPRAAPPASRASGGAPGARPGACGGSRRSCPGWRTSIWFEPPSLDASRSGLRSASRHCSAGSEVARRAHERGARAGAPGERVEPARRRLLEQRHVPLPAVEQQRRTRAAAGDSPARAWRRARSRRRSRERRREQSRVGREVATVVEVPAEDSH